MEVIEQTAAPELEIDRIYRTEANIQIESEQKHYWRQQWRRTLEI